jgi:hypothetical protein
MDRSFAPRVELVPFLDDDVPLVEGWLRSEHLRKSWIDTEVAISALHDLSRRGRQRIILVNDEPVGFLQWGRKVAATILQAKMERGVTYDLPLSASRHFSRAVLGG